MATVRKATGTDAAVLGQLLWDFNTEFDTETGSAAILTTRFERLLQRDDVIALMAGHADGFALITLRPAIWFDGPVAQLEELYVVPPLRDSGIGTELLTLGRQLAAQAASPEMHINVDEIDADTRRFYERHGFVNIEPGSDYRMLCYTGPTVEQAHWRHARS